MMRLMSSLALLVLVATSAPLAAEEKKSPATQPAVGRAAPDFSLANQNDKATKLTDFRGKWVVLYFYPKDDTSGCTKEACEFSDALVEFQKLDAVVLGVSADTTQSHRDFAKKHDLKITLLSDPERQVMSAYRAYVTGEEGKPGRVVRITYLIDPTGKIAYHWPAVKPAGHAEQVKKQIEEEKKKV